MSWYCYLLTSFESNKTYIGATNNLEKRLAKHNSGKGAKYTKGEKWFMILYVSGFENKNVCLSFESMYKKVSKRRKQSNLDAISFLTEMPLYYTNDPKHNRIMDLMHFLWRIGIDNGKFRWHGNDINFNITITVLFGDWIKKLPWPNFTKIL